MDRTNDPGVMLRVREILRETHDVRTLRLDNPAGLVPLHRPGQHVKLGVTTASGLAWKSFSLSSPPTRPASLDVTAKLKPEGLVSPALHTLREGDSVVVKGPSGRFFFDSEIHREPLFFLAAGIGITPIMSILRSIADLPIDRAVTVFYGCKSREDVVFADELGRMRERRLPRGGAALSTGSRVGRFGGTYRSGIPCRASGCAVGGAILPERAGRFQRYPASLAAPRGHARRSRPCRGFRQGSPGRSGAGRRQE